VRGFVQAQALRLDQKSAGEQDLLPPAARPLPDNHR
jgi:hypothetical protein